MRGEVEVFADGFLEIDLLAFAQTVVARIGIGRDDLIGLGELTVGSELGRMHLERLGRGVRIDVGGITRLRGLAGDDGDAALRSDHVLHEEGFLGHHRTPAGFIPAHGAVGEGHLEMAVVNLAHRHIFGEAGADTGDAHGATAGHEAHHIDIVDAAVDDRAAGLQERLVRLPHVTIALLVEVHAHDERLAKRLHGLDKLGPGRVVTEDIADDDLTLHFLGLGDDLLGFGDSNGQGLLDEDMATGFKCGYSIFGMSVRVARDRDRVGLRGLERGMEVAILRVAAAEFSVKLCPGISRAGDETDNLEAGQLMVSEGMRTAHVASTNAKDSNRGRAHAPSITLPSSASSREKVTERN